MARRTNTHRTNTIAGFSSQFLGFNQINHIMVKNDRTKAVDVKMKDPKLYKEIKHTFRLLSFVQNVSMLRNEITWKDVYNNLIVPNKAVLSTMKDADESFILHYAFRIFEGNAERVEHNHFLIQLVETLPHLIPLPDSRGINSLALAIQREDSESLILHMLELCPKSLEVLDNAGRFPLHESVTYRQISETIIMKMIESFPQAIEARDKYGKYPLHYAIQMRRSETLIVKMIEMVPKSLEVLDNAGRYPLHCSVINEHISETIIMKMIESFPHAIEARDKYGKYPLHYAIQTRRSETLIVKMIEMFPNTIQVPNNDGEYVLHFAIMHSNVSPTVIMKLIEFFPYAVEVPDKFGGHVLLHAICKKQSETVILKIIELAPQLVALPDRSGRFAAPYAIAGNIIDTIVLKMLDLYPQVLEKMDDTTIGLILRKADEHYSKKSKECTTSENPVLEKLNQLISNKKKRKYEF